MEAMEVKQDDLETLNALKAERDCLDPSFVHATRLLTEEIKKFESTGGDDRKATVHVDLDGKESKPEVKMMDVSSGKPIKLCVKIAIPVKDHPKFNFVGKLLGPRGNSLKRLQEETGTKMAILGKGSMRDKQKEDKLREENSQKYAHLHEELHVQIEVLGTTSDAYNRLAHGISEVQKYLVPDPNDDIRQGQLRELAVISGSYTGPPPSVTGSRGGRVLLPRGGAPGMGRGGWGGPGMRAMGPPPMRPSGPMSGPARLSSPPGRGSIIRGHAHPRGAPSRGSSRGGMARGGSYRGPGTGSGPRLNTPTSFSAGMGGEEDYYEGGYDQSYSQGYEETNAGDSSFVDYGGAGDGYTDTGYGVATETESWSSEGAPTTRMKYPSAIQQQQKETLRTHPYSRY